MARDNVNICSVCSRRFFAQLPRVTSDTMCIGAENLITLPEPEDICMLDISRQPTAQLPAALDNVMRESGTRPVSKTTSSVIVTSISSPSILNSPPGFHGNLKVAKTCTPISKELLDIARLETSALP